MIAEDILVPFLSAKQSMASRRPEKVERNRSNTDSELLATTATPAGRAEVDADPPFCFVLFLF
jgi:hypothetical protein